MSTTGEEPGAHPGPQRPSPGGWSSPGTGSSPGPVAVAAAAPTAAAAVAAPTAAAGVAVAAPTAAAGVAVARGDAPWPDSAEVRHLGAANPFHRLSPVTPTGVLDGGVDLLRLRIAPLAGLTAMVVLPAQVVVLVVLLRQGLPVGSADASSPWRLAQGGAAAFAAGFAGVLADSMVGFAAGVMAADLLDDRVRPGRALVAAAARRWWVPALVAVMAVPLKGLGLLLALVGFFLVDAYLMCSSVAAGAEGLGPAAAIGRSARLVRGNAGRAIGISVGAFAFTMTLRLVLFLGPGAVVSQFTTSETALLATQQAGSLAVLVCTPLTACIMARAYVDLRCRAEGLDLVRRQRDLGLAAGAGVGAGAGAAA